MSIDLSIFRLFLKNPNQPYLVGFVWTFRRLYPFDLYVILLYPDCLLWWHVWLRYIVL